MSSTVVSLSITHALLINCKAEIKVNHQLQIALAEKNNMSSSGDGDHVTLSCHSARAGAGG